MKKDKLLKMLLLSPVFIWLTAFVYCIALSDVYVAFILLKILGVAAGILLILFIKSAVKPIHRLLAWMGCKAQR